MKPTPKKATPRTLTAIVITALLGSAAGCSGSSDSGPPPATARSSATSSSSAPSASASSSPTSTANGANILLNASDRARLRQDAASLKSITAGCDSAMSYTAKPVADLNAARHYSSAGANAPDPVGKVLAADSQQAYRFAVCFTLTHDARYATAAQKIIDAWATTLKSASTVSGKDQLAFFMTPMTPAAAWVRGVNGWNGERYASFLTNVGLPNTKPVMAHAHNHGLWGVWYQSSAAAYLGDEALLDETQQRWQVLMAQETAPDGTMTNEVQRSGTSDYTGGADKGKKGLAYTNYAMLPATLAAKTFADQGKPVWNTPGGALLGTAYAKAMGWIVDPASFPYYASNHGQLEGVTTAGYAAILQQHHPNADGATLLSQKKITGDAYLLTQLFPSS